MRVARSPACRRVLRAVARRTGAAYSGWSEDAHAAGQHKSPITDALWRQRRAEQELYEAKGVDPDALPPQSQFVARSPQDSAVSIAYDFATNAALRDVYVNCWGELDEGLLFEDLDALAGNVAFRHAVLGHAARGVRPPLLVTASVDELLLHGALPPDRDLVLSGRVIFVGASSMLVRCHVEWHAAPPAPAPGPLLTADILYVARDRVTGKASQVNPIVCEAAADKALFDQKFAQVQEQKRQRTMSAESRLALDEAIKRDAWALLERSQALLRMPCLPGKPPQNDGVLVGQTVLQNTMLCQPQQRNTSGRIFGGFLMRRAYELALATAYCFAGGRPHFLWSDEITFRAPVNIGDVLRLDAHVILSEPDRAPQRVHCEVFASALRPQEAECRLTNRFLFSFALDAGAARVPRVHPSRTGEAVRQMEIMAKGQHIPDRGP